MNILNIFGADINLNFEGKKNYKTQVGLFLSLLFYIIVGLMIYLIGRDFFKRRNPKTSNYIDFQKNHSFYNLTNYEFNIMYIISDSTGKIVDEYLYKDLINIDVYFNKYSINGFEQIPLNSSICNEFFENRGLSDFEFSDMDLEYFTCVDTQNAFLFGSVDSDFYYSVSIDISSKIEISKYDKIFDENVKIKEFENIGLYLSLYVNDIKILPNDYTKGLAISYISSHYPISFENNNRIYSQKYFILNNLISDYGWIFKNSKEIRALGFSKEERRSLFGFFPNYLIMVEIFVEKNIKTYTREFAKIQTLLAELGGILNFFILVFSQLSYQYSFYHLMIKVYKTFINANENESKHIDKISIKNNSKIEYKGIIL